MSVGGQLDMDGTLNVFMHTASKYDDCRCLHFPKATFTMKFNWLCQGNCHDHHSPMPCVPERIAHRNSSEEYDTYANFRSKSLDWNINLDVQNTDNVSVCTVYIMKYGYNWDYLIEFTQLHFDKTARASFSVVSISQQMLRLNYLP